MNIDSVQINTPLVMMKECIINVCVIYIYNSETSFKFNCTHCESIDLDSKLFTLFTDSKQPLSCLNRAVPFLDLNKNYIAGDIAKSI